ncbi:MAG: glutathione S-transferase [Steroidobacteraceae bacterium]
MNPASSALILYSFRRCPYAMRARMALTVSAVGCVIREVLLRDKPAALLAASLKGTVPVMVLQDGRVIDESLDIMRWALGQNDPQQWLAPGEQMNDVIASNDGLFKFHLDRMKYANRYPGSQPAEHRAEAVKLLAPLEARLVNSAYLFGSVPSLADVALFPFVRQFAHADAAAFAAVPLPCLQAWLAGWESSALFQSVMVKYPVWQPGHEDVCLK